MAQNSMEAYHGTTVTKAERIVNEKKFHHSEADHDWLGSGVYFFAHRFHAEQWTYKKTGISRCKVVTVQLEYDDQESLDLDDPAQLLAVNREIEQLGDKIKDKLALINTEKTGKWEKWCLVCNIYRDLHPEIGVTFYTFSRRETEPSGFRLNEKQICVSHDNIIKDIR